MSKPLRVTTFNLLRASDAEAAPWEQRHAAAEKLLRQIDPDLLALQECEHAQLLALAEALPEHRFIGLGSEGGSHGDFVPLFFRPDRLLCIEYELFWLSPTPKMIGSRADGAALPRTVTAVLFEDRGSCMRFQAINTHLDYLSEDVQAHSAEIICDFLANRDRYPTVLLGDFNSPAGRGRAHEILTARGGFQDTTAPRLHGPQQATFFGRGDHHGTRVDWILSRGAIETSAAFVSELSTDPVAASDHSPLTCDLVIGGVEDPAIGD